MCSKTMFMCHCETTNIYSHFIPALYFLFQFLQTLQALSYFQSPEPKLKFDNIFNNPYKQLRNKESFYLLLIGSGTIVLTFLSSTIFHLYNCLNEKYYSMLLRIDLFGIALMIFTLCITAVYVGFHNHVPLRASIITVMLSIFFLNSILAMTPCYTQN